MLQCTHRVGRVVQYQQSDVLVKFNGIERVWRINPDVLSPAVFSPTLHVLRRAQLTRLQWHFIHPSIHLFIYLFIFERTLLQIMLYCVSLCYYTIIIILLLLLLLTKRLTWHLVQKLQG